MNIQPILEGNYFHIYNRGVNGEDLFKKETDYYYFLDRYEFYCGKILDTLAYCLMKNHFHLVAYVNENVEEPRRDGNGMFRLNASKQLGHLFNCYAQTINAANDRTGPLFESPFERKMIDNNDYLKTMIHYCHENPVHHGFRKDAKEWEFSSYRSVFGGEAMLVSIDHLLRIFGSRGQFEESYRNYKSAPTASKGPVGGGFEEFVRSGFEKFDRGGFEEPVRSGFEESIVYHPFFNSADGFLGRRPGN